MTTELATSDTLKATLVFTASNVTTAPATGRGLRIGLFNFSEAGANRVTADGFSTGAGGGAPGAGVTGYLLNMNFAQTFTIASPLQIMKRTDTTNINLMGASAVYAGISSGGGASGDPGFSNDISNTLEFSVKRQESSVEITTRFSNNEGWSISHTALDLAAPNTRFDALAIRPNSVGDTAESLTFTRFKVELMPYILRITSIQFTPGSPLTLTWDTLPNKSYQIEARPTLDQDSSWAMLGSVLATGSSATFDDTDAGFEIQRFYRVVQLP